MKFFLFASQNKKQRVLEEHNCVKCNVITPECAVNSVFSIIILAKLGDITHRTGNNGREIYILHKGCVIIAILPNLG